ncbi:MAG: SAM-dependent methyltransferase [Verrucomicrobiae bacterium]|nr:SAM-dependent methyltransferase [Verrucomicrobiae bacterium]
MNANPETRRAKLEKAIVAEIAARGPISFARFMELALYHPQWGYYTAPDAPARIGRRGDYFTNVSVGKVFGELLARQFATMWELMGKPAAFTLLELGAHSGRFAADVTAWIQRERPDFHAALRYVPRDYPGEVPDAVAGCIFSNEFFDSLPVHRITREQGEWREVFVTVEADRLAYGTGRLSSDALRSEIARLPLPEVDGYTTEVHCEARSWMRRLARALARGFVLTIDYGYVADDYYAPHRKDGTLLCYHQHRLSNEPLANIGEQDITAHVNFTTLVEEGAANGLKPLGLTDQARFTVGLLDHLGAAALAGMEPRSAAQLKTLLHPELMGGTFKVLAQQRGMDGVRLGWLRWP